MASSEEAKKATHQEFQGIIDFLSLQLSNQDAELQKYMQYKTKYHLSGSFIDIAIHAVQSRMTQTKLQRDYYQKLLNSYIAQGRA